MKHILDQCFSTAGLRPSTGLWHQLHRAARGYPGICHFSSENILRRIILMNVSKSSDPDAALMKLQYTTRFHWSID